MCKCSCEITYYWKHTPTGTTGTRTKAFISRQAFHEEMSKWNHQGNGVWIYWE